MTIFEKVMRIISLIVGICGLIIASYLWYGGSVRDDMPLVAAVSLYLVSLNPWSTAKRREKNNIATTTRSFIATLLFFTITIAIVYLTIAEGGASTDDIFSAMMKIITFLSPVISWYLVGLIMRNILINRYTLLSLIVAVSVTIMLASSKNEGNFTECGIGSVWEKYYVDRYGDEHGNECIPTSGISLKLLGIFFIVFYLTHFLLSSVHGTPRILNNKKREEETKEKRDDEVKKMAEAIVLADKMKKEKEEDLRENSDEYIDDDYFSFSYNEENEDSYTPWSEESGWDKEEYNNKGIGWH